MTTKSTTHTWLSPALAQSDSLDAATGKSDRFVIFETQFPYEVHWSPDGRTLFANYGRTGADRFGGQIGFLRSTGKEIEPITRDTNEYSTLSMSADGRTIATVLKRSYAIVSVLPTKERGFGEPQTLLSQTNDLDGWSHLSWLADRDLVVSSLRHVLKISTAGTDETELLTNSGAPMFNVRSCGANYVVLTWGTRGTTAMSVWRTKVDASGRLKLTDGKFDFWPVCSPDQ